MRALVPSGVSVTDDWQPVRIAPYEEIMKCPLFVEDGIFWPAGKIVLVRQERGDWHSPFGYRVHPESDLFPNCLLCEHQIQAD